MSRPAAPVSAGAAAFGGAGGALPPPPATLLDRYSYEKIGGSFACLGCGSFGAVFVGRVRGAPASAPCVAIKRIQEPDASLARKVFDAEVTRLATLRDEMEHSREATETIVQFIEGFIESDSQGGAIISIIMELCPLAKPWAVPGAGAVPLLEEIRKVTAGEPHGSSCDVLSSLPLPLKTVREIMRQVLTALAWLHAKMLIHRDVKPDNMLIFRHEVHRDGFSYPIVKLSDFGLSRAIDPMGDRYTAKVGTKAYRAPELSGKTYGQAVDIFSTGCSFFVMVLGELPNEDLTAGFPRRFEHIASEKLLAQFPMGSVQLDFFARLTQPDPSLRPSALEALSHPFMSAPLP